ncbi:MAG: type I-E CRISPR-associated protein Cse2/CasB [Armatimonadetes bacterium]|nr:type I-E CRISPR-associated protein Cse2/CasB [Armatimonadota bacterium]
MPVPTSRQREFVAYLESLKENRGAMAALRRGAGRSPGTAPEMFPYLVPRTQGLSQKDADLYYLVAALYALHPENTGEGNLGAALRQLALRRGPGSADTRAGEQAAATPERAAAEGEVGEEGSGSSAQRAGDAGAVSESVERRFVALLRANFEDLPGHLRRAVMLLASAQIPVPWAQLLADLSYWDHPERFIQRAWADSFWAGGSSAQAIQPQAEQEQESGRLAAES